MIGTGNDITTLNGLIETTFDSIDGYRDSAAATQNPQLRTLFETLSADRQKAVTDLRVRVRELGATPEDDGTLLGAAHRRFVDLKAMVTGRDDKAIVDEVERGEDHIKHKFEAALQTDDLSDASKAVIETAYASVKSGHDKVRNLKHSMKAATA